MAKRSAAVVPSEKSCIIEQQDVGFVSAKYYTILPLFDSFLDQILQR